ncbi:MAG: Asp-tRNA(Asn)/Glu-tRNA(Gln) amidotransferase subunit GatB [Planctomycetota bacterium]|nr:Asp-tRNA(Asn)/Glu-tRNA(Gln) amidotransferase subunit GatB [Planctomycetota bacterium]
MSEFEITIGLEVHVQLEVRSKLFAPSPYASGGEPNTRVSVVELGLPGVLPVVNERALELAVRAGIALEGQINQRIHFDRKNYFYPDLPKGYQISQYDEPFCTGGRVPLGDGRYGQLERIHLEEDAGKTTHTSGGSLVDLNRAGAALIEIVGQPDLHTPADAYAFLTQLKQILQYAGISECDMEKGLLRCDANISVQRTGEAELGTKVEIKNLNSFKMVQRALEYEARRQTATLANGGAIQQETRLWNEEKGESATMRSKESADDYRYFPDPDLPPISIQPAWVEELRAAMPELPAARRERFLHDYSLPEYDTDVLLQDRNVADYFETCAEACQDPKLASNWVMTEVLRALKERDQEITQFQIPATRLAEMIGAQINGRISRNAAKQVFEHLLEHDQDVTSTIEVLGLAQISDPVELERIVQGIIDANPQPVADFQAGKQKALHALQGLTMKATKGQANPPMVQEILRRLLDSP